MFIKLRKTKAQTTAEYAILIALVVGAVMAMQVYVKRGLQGRVKDVVDHTGSGGELGSTGDQLTFTADQYEPYYLSSGARSASQASDTESVLEGGKVTRVIDAEDTSQAARKQVTGWEAEDVAAPDLPGKAQ